MQHTIGTTSVDSKAVYEKLISLEIGGTVTYEELASLTGRNVKKHRHIVETARKMAMRDNQIVFDCLHGVGYKRLSDDEVISMQSVQSFSRIRSTIRNSVRKLTCANNASNDQVIAKNATLSILGTIASFSKPKAIETVKIQAEVGIIPTGKVMELFK